MGILGINNRTENWKTAAIFAPLLGDRRMRLAHLLGEDWQTEPHEVRLELFWKGMRDYIYRMPRESRLKPSECVRAYNKMFANLRHDIVKFIDGTPENPFRTLKDGNYDVSNLSGQKGLFDNLRNTEIDIVLETPSSLFIGEAKQESRLGAGGSLVLVHQLIRQYVTARILLHQMYCEKDDKQGKKEVVPFLVVDKGELGSMKETGQVRFMMDRGWFKEENVLTWDEIRGLHP